MTERRDVHRNELKDLGAAVSRAHRSLLEFQKDVQERLDEVKLSTGEVLQRSIHDPDYQWLRALSSVLLRIDESFDDEKVDAAELRDELRKELSGLFSEEGAKHEFQNRLATALSRDPRLWFEIAPLKGLLKRSSRPL